MKILVTGGTGYIGSHTVVELLGAGHSQPCREDQIGTPTYALDLGRPTPYRTKPR